MNNLITKYEGFSSTAYKCPAGVWTIGYGSTRWSDGSPINRKDTITKKRAQELLQEYIDTQITPNIKDLKLTTGQRIAVESLIYNIGWPAFSKSKCYKAIKTKDWETVFKNWDWIKGGGKVLPGLVKRRAEEMNLFFSEI